MQKHDECTFRGIYIFCIVVPAMSNTNRGKKDLRQGKLAF